MCRTILSYSRPMIKITPCKMPPAEAGPGHRACPLCQGTMLLEFDTCTGEMRSSKRRQGDEYFLSWAPEQRTEHPVDRPGPKGDL